MNENAINFKSLPRWVPALMVAAEGIALCVSLHLESWKKLTSDRSTAENASLAPFIYANGVVIEHLDREPNAVLGQPFDSFFTSYSGARDINILVLEDAPPISPSPNGEEQSSDKSSTQVAMKKQLHRETLSLGDSRLRALRRTLLGSPLPFVIAAPCDGNVMAVSGWKPMFMGSNGDLCGIVAVQMVAPAEASKDDLRNRMTNVMSLLQVLPADDIAGHLRGRDPVQVLREFH